MKSREAGHLGSIGKPHRSGFRVAILLRGKKGIGIGGNALELLARRLVTPDVVGRPSAS
ncbi:hypothetical protein D3C83_298310 [compost metagenome]